MIIHFRKWIWVGLPTWTHIDLPKAVLSFQRRSLQSWEWKIFKKNLLWVKFPNHTRKDPLTIFDFTVSRFEMSRFDLLDVYLHQRCPTSLKVGSNLKNEVPHRKWVANRDYLYFQKLIPKYGGFVNSKIFDIM